MRRIATTVALFTGVAHLGSTPADCRVVAVDGRRCPDDTVESCPADSWTTSLTKHVLRLRPGDEFSFRWGQEFHGITELPDKAALDACDVAHEEAQTIIPPGTNQGTSIKVGPVGWSGYYVCPVGKHCSSGMAIEVYSVEPVRCSEPHPVRKCRKSIRGRRCWCVKRETRRVR